MPAKKLSFIGHTGSVYALCKGPTHHTFFSSGADKMVVLWNLHKPEEGQLIARMPGTVYAIHYWQEARKLIVGVNQIGIYLLDIQEDHLQTTHPIPHSNWFRICTNQKEMFVAGSHGSLLHRTLGSDLFTQFHVGKSNLRAMDAHRNGSMILGNSTGEIFFQQAGKEMAVIQGHNGTVFSVKWYPDGERFISSGKDAMLKLWQLTETGEPIPLLKIAAHLFGIHDVALHPGKPILASGSMDKNIKIWDAENLKLLRVLDKNRHGGHSHSINQMLWMDEEDLLLSCSDDRTILAWNIYE